MSSGTGLAFFSQGVLKNHTQPELALVQENALDLRLPNMVDVLGDKSVSYRYNGYSQDPLRISEQEFYIFGRLYISRESSLVSESTGRQDLRKLVFGRGEPSVVEEDVFQTNQYLKNEAPVRGLDSIIMFVDADSRIVKADSSLKYPTFRQ